MAKVKVDHTGICMGIAFHKDETIEMSEGAITALGAHVRVVSREEAKPVTVKRVVKNKQIKRAPYQEVILEGVNRGPQVITKD